MIESMASIVILVAVACAALCVAVRSPFHAFCVFVTTLPFENALAFHGPLTITPAYLSLMLAVAITAWHYRRGGAAPVSSPVASLALVYLAIAVVSLWMTVVAPPPPLSVTTSMLRWRGSEFRSVLQVALLLFSASAFFVTLVVCSTPQRVRTATRLFIATTAVIGLYGLFQVVGAYLRLPLVGAYASSLFDTPRSLRPNATFAEAMNFGHFLVAGLPLLLAIHLHRERLTASDRITFGAPAVPMMTAMAASLLLTIGRGAWIGFAAALLMLLAASDGRARRRAAGLIVALAAVVLVVAWMSFGSIGDAAIVIGQRFDFAGKALTTEQRLWYVPFLAALVREHPLLGIGFGNYPLYQVFAFDLYGVAGAYGVFWQALVETGIAGLAAVVALMITSIVVVHRAVHRASPEWRPYLVGWAASLVGVFVPYFFFGDRLNMYVWVAMALAVATVRVSGAEA